MGNFNDGVTRRVRGELDRRGITQHELADRLDWHQAYLSRRLTGQVAWSTDDLESIASVFGLSPWQLVTDLIA